MNRNVCASKLYYRMCCLVLFYVAAAAAFNGYFNKRHFNETGTFGAYPDHRFETMLDGTDCPSLCIPANASNAGQLD